MRYIGFRSWCVLALALLLPTMATAQKLATGSGPGSVPPTVRIFDASGTETTLVPYPPGFAGGVRVALGDVDGDGVLDIVTGAGPGGGPHVRVWNGNDLTEITGFFAYGLGFAGGVSVAAGDVNGDGRADIITGAGAGGGPHVRIWDGVNGTEIHGFFAYAPEFLGGVNVAAADVDGDGRADIITGAGPGGGPHVRVWSGATYDEIQGFFAYAPEFLGGVNVAAADVDGDGHADIITGAGPGGGPHVRVWSGAAPYTELTGFFAYEPAFPGGVVVATMDLDRDGQSEIITGPARGSPLIRIWSGLTHELWGEYWAFDPLSSGGVTIGSSGGSSSLRFSSTDSATFSVTTAGNFSVTTVGGPVPALTVTGALPSGVTFTDNGDRTATLTGTPAANTGGSYPLTFTATVSGRTPVTQNFTLNVNQVPAITSAAAATFGLGGPSTFTFTTTGFPAPTLSSVGALPNGVTFTPNSDGTATLAGTPAAGSGGSYTLSITAANGVGTDAVQTFVLTVNSSPVFTSASATAFTVGQAGSFSVTTTATPPVNTITRTGALPSGVSFTDNGNGTATLAGTPDPGTAGTYTLTLTAMNGVGTNAVQTFTLTVRQAPAISSATGTTFVVGAAGSFGVTTTGFPAPTLTLTGALPSGVSFTDNGNGTATLAGTPAAATGGSYPVSITAANGAGSNAVQSFTLTVHQAPAFSTATATTFSAGILGTFTVATSGVPAVTTILRSGTLPTGVSFTSNGDGTGTLSGTPSTGMGGVYPLTFTINNGVGGNVVQNFTLTVTEAPAFTSATSTSFTVGSANSFTVTTTGQPGVTLITLGGVTLPSGVNFVSNGNGTATLSGNPAAGTGGSYAITFTANNGIGGNVVQNFTLNVNEPPAFTSATSTTLTVGSAGSFTITTTGFPAITTITRGGVALPSGVSYTDNGDGTATLSGTPDPGTAGAYAITFTINNGVGGNVIQNFTLNVNEPPAITSATSDSFIVGTADSFTVTATGFPTPTVTHTIGALPNGVTFTSATRVLAGTATQIGSFPIQFTAANGVGSDALQNFTLNVVCPAINVTPGSLNQGLYQQTYTSVDFDASGSTGSSFTWGATGLPSGLSISSTTGVVSGTPTDTVLSGAVAVTVTDNFGCTGTLNTTITVRPFVDPDSYSGGVGNTQYNVGYGVLTTPNVFVNGNVKANDLGPGTLSVTFGTPSVGSVTEGTTDGTFLYTPNAGSTASSDSFSYTLTDGNGVTNTGTVIISKSEMVWYVDNTYSGGNGTSDGRSHRPFTTLDQAQAPSNGGSFIYVHRGSGLTSGSLTMDLAQVVHGQGAAFTLNDLTIPATLRPTLSGTITAATNATIRYVSFSASSTAVSASAMTNLTMTGVSVTSGTVGVSLNGVFGTIDLDDVDFGSGGTTALSIVNVTGNVDVDAASSFSTGSGAEVDIQAGTGAVTINAPITNSNGRSISVQSRTTSGAQPIVFTGSITDTGQGIFLDNNDTTTITFRGGLSLSTGANPAFTATNGGTVNVCALSNCSSGSAVVNTLTTTTATALNVANTDIGSNGLTFRSISSNGGSNTGIILDNTGLNGLTVTGNGFGGSGGTIASKTGTDGSTSTGIGIYLNNTRNVSLSWMQLQNFANYAIRGLNVNGFTLASSTVIATSGTNGSDVAIDEGSVSFGVRNGTNGLTGTASVTNSTIEDGVEDSFSVFNSSGALTLTMDNVAISGSGNDGIIAQATDTASISIDVRNSELSANVGDHFNATADGNADLTVHFGDNGGNTLTGGATNPLGQSVVIQTGVAWNGSGVAFVSNNSINGAIDTPININAGGTGTFNVTVSGNTIGTSGVVGSGTTGNEDAIRIVANGDASVDGTPDGGTLTAAVINNTIQQVSGRGIYALARDGGTASDPIELNLTITGNILRESPSSGGQAIRVEAGATSTDDVRVHATIGGAGALANDLQDDWGTNLPAGIDFDEIRITHTHSALSQFILAGLGANTSSTATVNAYLCGRNTIPAGGVCSSTIAGGGVYETGGNPPVPLLADAGGVDTITAGRIVASESSRTAARDRGIVTQTEVDALAGAVLLRLGVAAQGIQFRVGALSGAALASFADNVITIDADGAGRGWFVDATPFDDSEFDSRWREHLAANPSGMPAGRYDLLSAIAHEIGHAFGLPDRVGTHAGDAMGASLPMGVRRLGSQ